MSSKINSDFINRKKLPTNCVLTMCTFVKKTTKNTTVMLNTKVENYSNNNKLQSA